MSALRGLACAAAALALMVLTPGAPSAHPMGNFSISHYTSIEVRDGALHILYRMDRAEIPTFEEKSSLDADGDGQFSSAEREAYRERQVQLLTAGQSLLVNGAPAVLEVLESALTVRPGAGDLPTLFLSIDYRVLLGPPGTYRISYRDDNLPDRTGWREIVARADPGQGQLKADVPAQDLSAGLSQYPQDLATAPPQVTRAELTLELASATADTGASTPAQTPAPAAPALAATRGTDPLARLITAPELSLRVLLFSIAVAFLLGGFHALSPGHGKTVVAAYLVGARGTYPHAVALGGIVTLTHTAGVFALGFVALFASRYIVPETLYPWFGFASGMIIVGIGGSQFLQRYSELQHGHAHHGHGHHHHAHDHDHDHHHGHEHAHDHGQHGHSHELPEQITLRSLIALGVSGGLVPCPSALVVLLSAITLHRIGLGLVLILAFSLGLATVLMAIGFLVLSAGRFLERFQSESGLFRQLPLVSSIVIAILGLVIAIQALVSAGIVPGLGVT